MGSGASKGARAKTKGFEATPGSAALRRRRRLLLGAEPGGASRDFEQIAPWEQFRAEINDPVFDRAEDSQEIRRSLEDVKDEMGYLRENAMELLQLNLRLPSKISRRLYHLARVQQNLGEPRKAQLTCFEVLGLSSALRWSSQQELLELLFCFFDADGDDRVGLDDLTRTIDAFLSLEDASASFSESEKKEFRKLDERRRMTEIRRIAQQALSGFAVLDSDDEEQGDEVEAEGLKGLGAEKAEPEKPAGADVGQTEGKEANEDGKGENGSMEHEASTSSKLAETGKLEMPKKSAGRGLCGRVPKQETPTGFEAAPSSMGKDKQEGGVEKPKEEAQPKAKAKAKPKAKQKPGGGLCGVRKPLTLSFRQWSRWIMTTDVLPPGLVAAALEASKPKPKPVFLEPGRSEVPGTARPGKLLDDAAPPAVALAIPEPKSPARSDDTPDDDVPQKGTMEPSRPLLSATS